MNTKINFEPNTEEQKELINLLQGKNFAEVQNLLNKYGSKVFLVSPLQKMNALYVPARIIVA